jgi:hypothetical protein
MNTKSLTALFGLTALALLAAGVTLAEEKLDPATINVSKYPDGIKENYEVFSTKCSQCHKLSRPINSDYALPDEWSRYIKRMMNKPGSGISAGDGKKIYEFLTYDSSVRKKAMLDEKLAKATPEDKAAAEAKIKELHDKYDAK